MKKVQFEFSDETYGAINQLAEVTGVRSMSAVMRDALKTYAWLIDEQRAGAKIYSQHSGTGVIKELVPLTLPKQSAYEAQKAEALEVDERRRGETLKAGG
jgi:predicted transcriptional regulator